MCVKIGNGTLKNADETEEHRFVLLI